MEKFLEEPWQSIMETLQEVRNGSKTPEQAMLEIKGFEAARDVGLLHAFPKQIFFHSHGDGMWEEGFNRAVALVRKQLMYGDPV